MEFHALFRKVQATIRDARIGSDASTVFDGIMNPSAELLELSSIPRIPGPAHKSTKSSFGTTFYMFTSC
ncbi:hypothetical protein M378DRAFT_157792, partial [Amanita muscaria Koide BX008]